jgi:hypothetical protein
LNGPATERSAPTRSAPDRSSLLGWILMHRFAKHACFLLRDEIAAA